ncbi:hypothetical protein [Actinacidiphila sp. ITFR-21]|uniref:hypothetical protein n=1 Tax=Actinacidiphila sp. ITFR-21 TaxID=3075199 RepID=UPI00288AEF9B|nr:hypothetical protein [Streptomyces sp. ITFR-21]WNI15960.1 hypothetical protein RLT57_10805 [Streptomyces sp. ITFR-21]
MSDLQVTQEVLTDTERLLGRLYGEFRTVSAHRDALHDAWGCGEVAAAMGAFVDNWSWYRKRLLTRIEAVGGLAGSARETFRSTDQRLAQGG